MSPGLTWVFYPNEIKVSSSEKQRLSITITVESENQFDQLFKKQNKKTLKANTRDILNVFLLYLPILDIYYLIFTISLPLLSYNAH